MIKLFIIIIFFSSSTLSREVGQTEITTDEGIEVFQNEKYYLLKNNVQIISDDFQLDADLVKAYFEKNMYDIVKIECEGSVVLTSSKGVIAKGQKLNFSPKNEDIVILGINSSLIYDKLNMQSDGLIEVNNINGKFNLNGKNSELKNDSIQIIGDAIKGEYKTINGINEVINLIVTDTNIANIITEKLNMFAIKATYFKDKNLIELFGNVKVITDNEIILGDHAKINTLTQSYKVVSKDSTKVKILINKSDE